MIMLAKVVPYGGNAVRYALEKEKAKVVKVNHMPEGIDPTAIWYMMKHHCQLHQQDRTVGRALERLMVQFVISPSKEEAANFTMKEWADLQDESRVALLSCPNPLLFLDTSGCAFRGRRGCLQGKNVRGFDRVSCACLQILIEGDRTKMP